MALLWAIGIYTLMRYISPDWVNTLDKVGFLTPRVLINNLFYITQGFLIVQFWSLTQEVLFYIGILLFFIHLKAYLLISLFVYLMGWFVEGVWFSENGRLVSYLWHFNALFFVGVLVYKNFNPLLEFISSINFKKDIIL